MTPLTNIFLYRILLESKYRYINAQVAFNLLVKVDVDLTAVRNISPVVPNPLQRVTRSIYATTYCALHQFKVEISLSKGKKYR